MGESNIVISAFADEARVVESISDPVQQLTTINTMGLEYYTIRFWNFTGNEGDNNNIINFPIEKAPEVVESNKRYGLKVSTIGSPIGKSGLIEGMSKAGGDKADYMSMHDVLEQLDNAFKWGEALDSRLIRGFSF